MNESIYSFTERMRKRALERLERNAHILRPEDVEFDQPALKPTNRGVKSPSTTVFDEPVSKSCKDVSDQPVPKPVYKDVIDEPASKLSKDVFDQPALKPSNKDVSNQPAVKSPIKDVFNQRARNPYYKPASENLAPRTPPKLLMDQCVTKAPITSVKTPKTPVLDQSVVKTLESQGYTRTVSDAHLFYDFKQAKSNFNKENVNVNPLPKPKRQFDGFRKPEKPEKKEIANLYSSSKYQSNVFIQNSRKIEEESSPDPCLLSVAERRKLFEKRLAGAETPAEQAISKPSPPKIQKISESPKMVPTDDENCKSENEYSTCESEENSQATDDDIHGSSETPASDGDISSEHEEQKTDNEADVSVYPVLQTVKQVKFVSTPKPGRLYPSVSDLDGEVDDDVIPKHEASFKTLSNDDSFGREVLCATNSIFSSFQNSRKDASDAEKSRADALAEVKELITPDYDTSLSLSPVLRTSTSSVECANETASFTFMKAYSNNSVDASPIPLSINKNTVQSGFVGGDECDAKIEDGEMNVDKKIKLLEEQVVKEKIILTQEIRALKYCQSTSFVNSQSHLEAERLVLLSQLRIEAAQNEIQRLKVENTLQSPSSNSVCGNVVISKIRLPVKMSVVHANLKDEIENNLLCIIKCGDVVLASDVVPVVQSKIRKDAECTYIEFPDSVTVPDVTSDFKIRIEVYNLVVDKKDQLCPKNKDGAKKDKKNQNLNKKSKRLKMFTNPYTEEKKSLHSSFSMIGYMIFSQNVTQRHQWMLNKFQLPLVGMIMMELKCNLAKITVQKHGFLTMYEIISGYGAWCRYWFHLNGDKLSFWKYPEQENVKDPIGTFDLQKCVTKNVVVVGYDVVFRPQTFILKFAPPTYLKQFKGLTEDRLLLSADNEEERISWCDCLNEVLNSVRSWSNPSE